MCDACGQPASNASGGRLWVSRRGFQEAARKRAAWKSEFEVRDDNGLVGVSLGELMSEPDPEPWHVSHGGCILDETAYALDLPRDYRQWLAHVAHLLGKNWINDTDFDELIEEAASNTKRCALVPSGQEGTA